jgi:mRNA interferase RelE/StbE
MGNYTILLSKKAIKHLDNLTDDIAEPIFKAIAKLEENPRPLGYKKLKGRDGFRIRVGNYRIIYEIFETQLSINIIAVGHRKNIYE